MVDYDCIHILINELSQLGCRSIVWTPDDFPGETEAERIEQLSNFAETLEDVCIRAGNEAITNEFGDKDELEDE